MRARWLCLAALALAPPASGCGRAPADVPAGKRLTVYSSLPLQGASAAVARQILDGERLALADASGRAGRLRVRLVSLDDSSPRTGEWDPGMTEANAKLVARDSTAIAYVGEYDSAATAVSLPLTNGAGILQVSPASPYAGLTTALDAGQDEPERFYPTSVRTFGRVAPGDRVQAAAQVALMRTLGVRSVYAISDQDPFDGPLAQLLAAAAARAGIALRGDETLDVPRTRSDFTAEVARVAQARPAAVFLSGAPSAGAASLFQQLHDALPGLRLLGSASLNAQPFIARLGSAARATLLGTAALPLSQYPASARRVLRRYRRRFGVAPSAYALYGYEAMSVVLSAIRAAGARGDERRAVIERFFATRARHSVLGTYSMLASGEPTLSRYGIARVDGDAAVLWRAFSG